MICLVLLSHLHKTAIVNNGIQYFPSRSVPLRDGPFYYVMLTQAENNDSTHTVIMALLTVDATDAKQSIAKSPELVDHDKMLKVQSTHGISALMLSGDPHAE